MQAYRLETTLQQDGTLTLQNLPLKAGTAIEVIILSQPAPHLANPYPLRGLPVTYQAPFVPVSENEWEGAA